MDLTADLRKMMSTAGQWWGMAGLAKTGSSIRLGDLPRLLMKYGQRRNAVMDGRRRTWSATADVIMGRMQGTSGKQRAYMACGTRRR
jgi:hypothetical protein